MFGSGISFSGLASGLDTTSIVTQLVALERLPIQQLETQRDEAQTKLDLVGNFGDLVKSLQTAADSLRASTDFYSFSTSMSVEGTASVSAGSGAAPGTHTLEVLSTASTDRWAFDGVVDSDTALGGGNLSFDVNGTSYNLAVDAGTSSLNEIASQINGLTGDDVSASVVNTGTDSSPSYQLVLGSGGSGEDLRISNIVSTVAGFTIDATGPDAQGVAQSANNITVGMNAVALVDGLQVERSDNDFGDVVQGVSINILSAQQVGEPAMIFTVQADQEAMKGRVQGFVDEYNKIIDFVNTQNAYSEESGTGGELFGDSILSTVRRQITNAIFDVDIGSVIADTEGYSTLSLIGIGSDSDGRLSIDDSVFDDKLAANVELVAALFADDDGFDNGGALPNTPGYFTDTTADTGLAEKLYRAIDQMFKTQDGPDNPITGDPVVLSGIFKSREDALKDNISRFGDSIDNKERLLELFEESLVLRFASLEQTMGQLNAQGAALQSTLFNLPSVN
jgi:flagellar hook-associated protein 2